MIKKRTLRNVILSIVLAQFAVSFLTLGANASVGAPLRIISDNASSHASAPKSTIKGTPGKEDYLPNTLHVRVGNSHPWYISNKTKVPQTVTYNGSPIATIPPGGKVGFYATQPGTYMMSLVSNPAAKLTIIAK